MNWRAVVALCAMLFLTQSCDKIRGTLAAQFRAASRADSFNGPVVELAETDYESFINQRGYLIVVNFHADWCGPCRQLGPGLERVSAEFGEAVKLGTLDVDKARNVVLRSGVRNIPDVRFFRDGKQVYQFTGAQPEGRVREILRQLTIDDNPQDRKPESLVRRIISPPHAGEDEKTAGEEATAPIRPMEKDWLPPGIERR